VDAGEVGTRGLSGLKLSGAGLNKEYVIRSMKEYQWEALLRVMEGEVPENPLAGFIIDSPWLPGWYGISTLQYFTSERMWFQANREALSSFPDLLFFPGYWAEFGMCTEPSAFGARTIWPENDLPFAERVMRNVSEVDVLVEPDPRRDGLLPFVIRRLSDFQPLMEKEGHCIKFAVARGPLNIASFLLGTTELMTAFMTEPEKSSLLIEIITRFLVRWIQWQKEKFPSIDGIFILDDLVGFLGEEECRHYAVPYLRRIFGAFEARVNFFHSDAHGLIIAPLLQEMGVNVFNFSFEHSLTRMRELAGPGITLAGNLPPRDVLASGTPEEVFEKTKAMVGSMTDRSRIVWSAGGGMPPGVGSNNIRAFIEALK